MTKLPRVPGPDIARALTRGGFERVSTKGSHAKMRHPKTGRVAIVPLHPTVAVGTLASILRQAGLTADEFRDLLR